MVFGLFSNLLSTAAHCLMIIAYSMCTILSIFRKAASRGLSALADILVVNVKIVFERQGKFFSRSINIETFARAKCRQGNCFV